MILPSASDKLMSTGTYYPFVQDSNFHYLTGFVEADAILLVSTVKGTLGSIFWNLPLFSRQSKSKVQEPRKGLPFPQHKATLYVSERDELMVENFIWTKFFWSKI